MKKSMAILILMLTFILQVNIVFAAESKVEIKVNGDIKKNNNIEILVNLKNMKNLYAGSIDFEYDNSLLKIESIEPSEFISNDKNDISEFAKETDKKGNIASYYFTFLGDKKGLSGNGNFVTIKAKVMKSGKLSITKDNMRIKLVEKDSKNKIKYLNYQFTVDMNKIQIESEPVLDNNTESDANNNGSNDNLNNENNSTNNNLNSGSDANNNGSNDNVNNENNSTNNNLNSESDANNNDYNNNVNSQSNTNSSNGNTSYENLNDSESDSKSEQINNNIGTSNEQLNKNNNISRDNNETKDNNQKENWFISLFKNNRKENSSNKNQIEANNQPDEDNKNVQILNKNETKDNNAQIKLIYFVIIITLGILGLIYFALKNKKNSRTNL